MLKPYSKEDIDIIREISEGHDFVVIKLVTLNERKINFIIKGIKYKVIGSKEGSSYYWKDPAIIIANLPNLGCVHVIVANSEGIKFNRRESFRLWLGQSATIRFGEDRLPYDIVLKDISTLGIGLLVSSSYEINKGDEITVQFRDEYIPNGRSDYVSALYTIEAKVVRVVARDDKMNIIGCTILTANTDISKFITKKQMERARVGGRKALYTKKKDKELFDNI